MARYLIDSQIFFRAVECPEKLLAAETTVLTDPRIDIVVSVASIWELSIKMAIGRLKLSARRGIVPPNHFADSAAALGIPILPIEAPEAEYVRGLPQIHGDPFDRILIAQALIGRRIIMTRDAVFAHYPGVQIFGQ